jgi:hypothetical protein
VPESPCSTIRGVGQPVGVEPVLLANGADDAVDTSAPLLSMLRRARLAPTGQGVVPMRDFMIGHHPMQEMG